MLSDPNTDLLYLLCLYQTVRVEALSGLKALNVRYGGLCSNARVCFTQFYLFQDSVLNNSLVQCVICLVLLSFSMKGFQVVVYGPLMMCKVLEGELLQRQTKPHYLLWLNNPELSPVPVHDLTQPGTAAVSSPAADFH